MHELIYKTFSSHELLSGMKELETQVHNFLCTLLRLLVPCMHLEENRATRDTFFWNHEPNHVLEMSLSYLQNIPIYHPLENINLQFVPF